jgi:quinol monooxygenase YgiN
MSGYHCSAGAPEARALADGEEVRNRAAGDAIKRTRAERPVIALSLKGRMPMTVTLGILAMLEAKPGKGGELEAFLRAGRELAVAEEGTVTWYAFKISDTSYGIFDTFATDDARTAHINGQIPAALAKVSADLLASEPDIRPVDVLAVK